MKSYTSWLKGFLLAMASLACLLAPSPVFAQMDMDAGSLIAVLGVENSGGDPRQDYLGPVFEGLISFDLSSRASLSLVERKKLDSILMEKELAFSDLTRNPKGAGAAMSVLGVDYLVWGDYSFVGGEVALNLSLARVDSGQVFAFRERGTTENVGHSACEQLVKKLTGRDLSLQDKGLKRSLMSLKDETPGTIALYSRMQRARIFIDDVFVGYTKGEAIEPILFEMVPPGEHRIRTHLDDSFGVLASPSFEFRDWEEKVTVEANRRVAVEDKTQRLNDIIYWSAKVYEYQKSLPKSKILGLAKTHEASCLDLSGARRAAKLELKPSLSGEALSVECLVDFEGRRETKSLKVEKGQADKKEGIELGFYTVWLSLGLRGDEYRFELRVERNDLGDIEPSQSR